MVSIEGKCETEIMSACSNLGVDPSLIKAIISVESSWLPYSIRYEPHYSYTLQTKHFADLCHISESLEIEQQKCSWGLMQMMGGSARSLGFLDHLHYLCDPKISIYWGSLLIRRLSTRYSNRLDVIAAYNAGSPRRNQDDGKYENQVYVDKVLAALKKVS